MTNTDRKDRWLESQIEWAIRSLRKRPETRRGPWIITDAELDKAIQHFDAEREKSDG